MLKVGAHCAYWQCCLLLYLQVPCPCGFALLADSMFCVRLELDSASSSESGRRAASQLVELELATREPADGEFYDRWVQGGAGRFNKSAGSESAQESQNDADSSNCPSDALK